MTEQGGPGGALTFPLLGRVGQQRRGEDVHAVLVEKAEELGLLGFLQRADRKSGLL